MLIVNVVEYVCMHFMIMCHLIDIVVLTNACFYKSWWGPGFGACGWTMMVRFVRGKKLFINFLEFFTVDSETSPELYLSFSSKLS